MERDYEAYMRELEEDPELRADVLLYRNQETRAEASGTAAAEGGGGRLPAIGVDELLDDMTLVDDDEGIDEDDSGRGAAATGGAESKV